MTKLSAKLVATGLTGMLALGAIVTSADAHGVSYCKNYARNTADHYANPGTVVAGTILGAATGALFGAAVGGHHAVGTGALIGGVGGTVAGGVYTGDKWHRVYNRAYADCRAH
jgi:hypothetical protein